MGAGSREDATVYVVPIAVQEDAGDSGVYSMAADPGVEGGSAVTSARTKAWPLPAHHAAEVMSLGLGEGYQQEPLLAIVMFSVLQPS